MKDEFRPLGGIRSEKGGWRGGTAGGTAKHKVDFSIKMFKICNFTLKYVKYVIDFKE
jgi:hypothetical protein